MSTTLKIIQNNTFSVATDNDFLVGGHPKKEVLHIEIFVYPLVLEDPHTQTYSGLAHEAREGCPLL